MEHRFGLAESVGLASDIEVLVDQANTPHLVYRHDATDQLELAIGAVAELDYPGCSG